MVTEFEKAILSDSEVKPVKLGSQSWFRPLYYLNKITRKAGIHLVEILTRFLVLDSSDKEEAYFAVLMGQDFNKFYPYAFLNRKKRYIYFFDAWTKEHSVFVDFIRRCKIDRVFVSASQAATELNEKLGRSIASWIPEGIDVTAYKEVPYDQKDIDVIQIGRKYDRYHEQILPFFNGTNRIYLYEKTKGTVIFPDREDFINGLARSKISICVPSNITHPNRSGAIETITNRYLQSMASKCLIVGHAPKEMFSLLGFTEAQAQAQFGFLMNAFKYGAPPHGGIAFGLDRLVSIFAGLDSIRDCIAFPKNNSGRDVMIDAPAVVSDEQLEELHLTIQAKKLS
ncbi:hypothetical protein FACS1894177_09710 [Bacteroidia bacterium]|nr:hypothetical protein FACS1894177_09710 [Bacteroidia bacterium]